MQKLINKLKTLMDHTETPAAPVPSDPYSAGRLEWNERYGSYIKAAKDWRLVGIISLSLATLGFPLSTYVWWELSQKRYVPYIIHVDKLGTPVMAGFPSQIDIEYVDERVIRSLLGQWISSFRSVTPDGVVQKKYIDHTYSMLNQSDPAGVKVHTWILTNNPNERAREKTVSVEVTSVIALSKKSYQIDWREIERDRQGKEMGTRRFRSIAHVSIVPPQDEKVVHLNPIGLYIRDLDWAVQL
jgi:type IV secretion system protein TrbF